jgi:hypothetical protein
MGQHRGVVLLTIPPEAADRFDWVAQSYELSQEQVAVAAVAMLSSMIESRDQRALQYMQMVRDQSHRSLDAQLTTHYRGGIG